MKDKKWDDKKKGRGYQNYNHKEYNDNNYYLNYNNFSNEYTSVEQANNNKNEPFKSVEGYIIFASGINKDASEDIIFELFQEYGNVKNMHVNLDRQTGYFKGYVLIEYEHLEEAQKAVKELNGKEFYNKTLKVNFAFKKN